MTATSASPGISKTRAAITSGMAWNTAARVIQLVTQFAGTALLARLLVPGDFGIVSMSAILLNIANALADFGVRAYVVHRPDLDDQEIEAAKLVSWVLGLIICGAIALAAVPMAWFYREPRLAPVLALQALLYLVASAGTVHYALHARSLSFDRLAKAEIAGSVVYLATAVTLAAAGAGYWSMVLGRMASGLTGVVILSGMRRLFPRRVPPGSSRHILKFGGTVAATGIVAQLDENLDNIVVGRLFGPGNLGIYAVAYNLAALPQRYLAYTVAGVLNPIVARAANQPELQRILARYARYQLLGPGAIAVAIGVLAPEVIAIILGGSWLSAIPFIRVMSCSTALLTVSGTLVHGALITRGQPRALLGFYLAKVAMTAAGVFLGVPHGAIGVAWGFLGASAVSFVAGLVFVERRLQVSGLLRAVLAPMLVVAGCAAAGMGLRLGFVPLFDSSFAILGTAGLLYAALYVTAVLVLLPDVRADLAPTARQWCDRILPALRG